MTPALWHLWTPGSWDGSHSVLGSPGGQPYPNGTTTHWPRGGFLWGPHAHSYCSLSGLWGFLGHSLKPRWRQLHPHIFTGCTTCWTRICGRRVTMDCRSRAWGSTGQCRPRSCRCSWLLLWNCSVVLALTIWAYGGKDSWSLMISEMPSKQPVGPGFPWNGQSIFICISNTFLAHSCSLQTLLHFFFPNEERKKVFYFPRSVSLLIIPSLNHIPLIHFIINIQEKPRYVLNTAKFP